VTDKNLLVLDMSGSDISVTHLWEKSRFLEKLSEICFESVVWDPNSIHTHAETKRFDDFNALVQFAESVEADSLVLVDSNQIFLDQQIVSEGLKSFRPQKIDYFTQWEHCRLPVGIGVRAISTRVLEQEVFNSPKDCINHIQSNPSEFKFHYDMVHQTPYEDTLLDSRDSPSLRLLVENSNGKTKWGLGGFLSIAKKAGEDAPLYQPDVTALRVDERKMPAAYGFESPECAEFPTYIMFDIINICNAKCIHCPQSLTNLNGGKPDFLSERGHLSMETYKQVIDECSEHKIQFVRITADGEPLVHKQLVDMVKYAKEKGVGPVGLTTNGSLLKPDRIRKLIEAGLFMVDFSLDASTPETFEVVRTGLKWDKVVGSVHEFIKIRDELGASTKIMVSFVKQGANIHELDDFVNYWTPIVDEVLIREMISNVGLVATSESEFAGWDHRWPCVHFFRRVVINHQGVLKACPIDWQQKTAYRSMDQTSVHNAWHSHHYWMNRMEHLNDEIPDERVCKSCKDWAGTPWKMGYEKVVASMGD